MHPILETKINLSERDYFEPSAFTCASLKTLVSSFYLQYSTWRHPPLLQPASCLWPVVYWLIHRVCGEDLCYWWSSSLQGRFSLLHKFNKNWWQCHPAKLHGEWKADEAASWTAKDLLNSHQSGCKLANN